MALVRFGDLPFEFAGDSMLLRLWMFFHGGKYRAYIDYFAMF